jgi:secreted PhoX family phosphatase
MRQSTLLLSTVLGLTSLNACVAFGTDNNSNDRQLPVRSINFTATPAPTTESEMTSAYTRSSVVVTLMDGKTRSFPLSYNVLYSSGDQIGNWKAGTVVDKTGAPLDALRDDQGNILANGPFYARSPDANSLVVRDKTLSLVTHFEYDTEAASATDPSKAVNLYGQLPMVMNLASLRQKADGTLSVFDLTNIGMQSVDGLWIPCAGELTPWNTHVGGEEYEPDARAYENRPLTPMNRYLGTNGLTTSQGGANAYRYGLAVEVTLNEKGNTSVVKHYAPGRLANELAHVMPDRRTAYKGDDGRDVILSMFVADRANDLSAGTLYAAQLEQRDGANGGQFNIRWIQLGHASDREIQALVDGGIRFSHIFDAVSKTTYQANPALYADYRPVYVYTGTDGINSNTLEYLRVKPGMEKAAAFLETRRYAAYLGATAEFTKMEGVTSNRQDKKLYVAMSYVQKAMLAGQNADRPRDDIRLNGDAADLECGIVYESNVTGDQTDSSGQRINSKWVAADLRALVTGAKKPTGQSYGKYDKCDTDKMANPDNIKYSEALRTLFIGEDSGNHMNNFLWAYSVDSQQLVRLATTRFGAEWTGLQAIDSLNGYAYVMSNIQHPGATEDTAGYRAALEKDGINFDAFRAQVDARGAVGYLGGMPALRLVNGQPERAPSGD